MDKHTATEQAYKNGYEAGVKEFAERLKERAVSHSYCNAPDFKLNTKYEIWDSCIDNLLTELTERKEDEGK